MKKNIPKEDLLFIDTETGGVDPFRCSLLDIALIPYINGEKKEPLQFYIKEREYRVTPKALSINKIDLQILEEKAVGPGYAALEIRNQVDRYFKQPPILAGHNIGFDRYFLRELFLKSIYEFDAIFSHRTVDTLTLLHYHRDKGNIPLDVQSLSSALKFFGIRVEQKHTALDDALSTILLYEKLMKL